MPTHGVQDEPTKENIWLSAKCVAPTHPWTANGAEQSYRHRVLSCRLSESEHGNLSPHNVTSRGPSRHSEERFCSLSERGLVACTAPSAISVTVNSVELGATGWLTRSIHAFMGTRTSRYVKKMVESQIWETWADFSLPTFVLVSTVSRGTCALGLLLSWDSPKPPAQTILGFWRFCVRLLENETINFIYLLNN